MAAQLSQAYKYLPVRKAIEVKRLLKNTCLCFRAISRKVGCSHTTVSRIHQEILKGDRRRPFAVKQEVAPVPSYRNVRTYYCRACRARVFLKPCPACTSRAASNRTK